MKHLLLLAILVTTPTLAYAQDNAIDLQLHDIDAESSTATSLYGVSVTTHLLGIGAFAAGILMAPACISDCSQSYEATTISFLIGGMVVFALGIATTIAAIVLDVRSGARRRRHASGPQLSVTSGGVGFTF